MRSASGRLINSAKMSVLAETSDLVKSLKNQCEKHKIEAEDDQFIKRALEKCEELKRIDVSSKSPEILTKWIQAYTQAVLDLTCFEENQVVQSDFSEDNAEQSLSQFMESLSQPEEFVKKWMDKDATECAVTSLCSMCAQPALRKPIRVLGEELWECLLWRKGALMYMYCATCMEQQGRPQRHLEHFIKCAHDGVKYLEEMLKVRGPLQLARNQVTTNDESTFKLLLKGVYSDTHVLALMYAGEMCHWYETMATAQILSVYVTFDPYLTGTHMLRTYIDVVIGPLKGQGWSTQRAQDLLTLLKTDQCSTQLKQSTL